MRSALLAKTSEIEKLIDSALSGHEDLERQLRLTQLLDSAAPGPGRYYDDQVDTYVYVSPHSDSQECSNKDCLDGYGNGHQGARDECDHDIFTGMFFSCMERHAERNLKQFPDLYGDRLWGFIMCYICEKPHEDGAFFCPESWVCSECLTPVWQGQWCPDCNEEVYFEDDSGEHGEVVEAPRAAVIRIGEAGGNPRASRVGYRSAAVV